MLFLLALQSSLHAEGSALGVAARVGSAGEGNLTSEPREGHGGSALSLAHVLFLVMASADLPERALWVSKTWCSYRASRCLFVAERPICARGVCLPMLEIPRGQPPRGCCEQNRFFCRAHTSATLHAQYRFLPALLAAKQSDHVRSGAIRWTIIVDDDSFVFPPNLLGLLGRLPHRRPLYLGDFGRSPVRSAAALQQRGRARAPEPRALCPTRRSSASRLRAEAAARSSPRRCSSGWTWRAASASCRAGACRATGWSRTACGARAAPSPRSTAAGRAPAPGRRTTPPSRRGCARAAISCKPPGASCARFGRRRAATRPSSTPTTTRRAARSGSTTRARVRRTQGPRAREARRAPCAALPSGLAELTTALHAPHSPPYGCSPYWRPCTYSRRRGQVDPLPWATRRPRHRGRGPVVQARGRQRAEQRGRSRGREQGRQRGGALGGCALRSGRGGRICKRQLGGQRARGSAGLSARHADFHERSSLTAPVRLAVADGSLPVDDMPRRQRAQRG